MTKGPTTLETPRLVLRKPAISDAHAVFERYAGDPAVTRYMSWPTHKTVADTCAFLAWSDADWDRWPAGSYLVHTREGKLLGGTGLSFRTPLFAATGYVFARDAWGQGFATEALRAMVDLAQVLGLKKLEAGLPQAATTGARAGFLAPSRRHTLARASRMSPARTPLVRPREAWVFSGSQLCWGS